MEASPAALPPGSPFPRKVNEESAAPAGRTSRPATDGARASFARHYSPEAGSYTHPRSWQAWATRLMAIT